MLAVAAAVAVLAGFDCYLSHRRMAKYGAAAELNPIAQQIARDAGPNGGLAFLVIQNTCLIAVAIALRSNFALYVLLGAKLALVACQLKSLQLELFIDKIFAARNSAK